MTSQAASLVASAKKWATYYGDYSNGEEGAALTALLRARAAWEANDADAFAEVFIENGSMLAGDNQYNGREQIRGYMTEAFDGALKGTRLTEQPLEITMISATAAIAVMDGGVVRAGEDALAEANLVRAMWVVVKRDGDWHVASYQSCPIKS